MENWITAAQYLGAAFLLGMMFQILMNSADLGFLVVMAVAYYMYKDELVTDYQVYKLKRDLDSGR